jgi:hypothetical protein
MISLSMIIPKSRLNGYASTSPLAHFYIHHSDSSVRELHPFTTTTHLDSRSNCTPADVDSITIQFLFRKSNRKSSRHQELAHAEINAGDGKELHPWNRKSWRKGIPPAQWTNKLASLAHQDEPESLRTTGKSSRDSVLNMIPSTASLSTMSISSTSALPTYEYPSAKVSFRLEGPYYTPAKPANYGTVICLVAGTGVSGAIAIANAFIERRNATALNGTTDSSTLQATGGEKTSRKSDSGLWRRCLVVWTVKEEDYVELPFVKFSLESGLEFRTHLTGQGRQRLDIKALLAEESNGADDNAWVYISGPNRFILAAEKACKATPGIAYYGARWDI